MTLTDLATALKESFTNDPWKPALAVFYGVATLTAAITVGAVADTEGHKVKDLIVLYNKIYFISLAFNLLVIFLIARYEEKPSYTSPEVSSYRKLLIFSILGYGFQGAMLSMCLVWNIFYQLFTGTDHKSFVGFIDAKLENLVKMINKVEE